MDPTTPRVTDYDGERIMIILLMFGKVIRRTENDAIFGPPCIIASDSATG